MINQHWQHFFTTVIIIIIVVAVVDVAIIIDPYDYSTRGVFVLTRCYVLCQNGNILVPIRTRLFVGKNQSMSCKKKYIYKFTSRDESYTLNASAVVAIFLSQRWLAVKHCAGRIWLAVRMKKKKLNFSRCLLENLRQWSGITVHRGEIFC